MVMQVHAIISTHKQADTEPNVMEWTAKLNLGIWEYVISVLTYFQVAHQVSAHCKQSLPRNAVHCYTLYRIQRISGTMFEGHDLVVYWNFVSFHRMLCKSGRRILLAWSRRSEAGIFRCILLASLTLKDRMEVGFRALLLFSPPQ